MDLYFFGFDMKVGILVLAIPHVPAGPGALIDVIAWGCVAQGKACSTQYSLHYHHIDYMDGGM